MAKGKGKGPKKFKSGIPLEEEQRILAMSPTDLAVEVTFERNAIEAITKQSKEDLSDKRKDAKKFEDALNATKEVADAKEKYELVKADHMDDDHVELKADIAALSQGYANDKKDRKKKLKYMEKMLKRHIESGALKRKA